MTEGSLRTRGRLRCDCCTRTLPACAPPSHVRAWCRPPSSPAGPGLRTDAHAPHAHTPCWHAPCLHADPKDGGPPPNIAEDHKAEVATRQLVISGPTNSSVPPFHIVFAIALPVFVPVDDPNDTFGYGPDSARCGRDLPCYDNTTRTKWWVLGVLSWLVSWCTVLGIKPRELRMPAYCLLRVFAWLAQCFRPCFGESLAVHMVRLLRLTPDCQGLTHPAHVHTGVAGGAARAWCSTETCFSATRGSSGRGPG